jgi:hypothetical protein
MDTYLPRRHREDTRELWLRQRLEEDYGRPVDGDLRAAVDTIAKRLLREDLTHGLPVRERESVPSGATATAL